MTPPGRNLAHAPPERRLACGWPPTS